MAKKAHTRKVRRRQKMKQRGFRVNHKLKAGRTGVLHSKKMRSRGGGINHSSRSKSKVIGLIGAWASSLASI
jgi:hypothetical protein